MRGELNGRRQKPRGNQTQESASQTSGMAAKEEILPSGQSTTLMVTAFQAEGAEANGADGRKGAGTREEEDKEPRSDKNQNRWCGSRRISISTFPGTQDSQQPGHSSQPQIGQ